jgi:cystine transport system ATP-binding protein/L-cystine transport system ATP-binding protein
MPLMEVKGLEKSFGSSRILSGIDLSIEKGDVTAVLGPSGSGKTTLLRCLNYLEKADSGTMYFGEQTYDMAGIRAGQIAQIRRHTGFVFQNYNLFANKTALDNVTLGLRIAGRIPRRQAEQTGMEMLEKVGMAEYRDYYPVKLSGGQQQRVAIARALAAQPSILFFDEPTSALDPELIGEVLRVMRDLAQEGMTMLVVTHEMNFARNVSNKVIFMEDGKIIERGDSGEFFRNPRQERAREFLSRIDNQHSMEG